VQSRLLLRRLRHLLLRRILLSRVASPFFITSSDLYYMVE